MELIIIPLVLLGMLVVKETNVLTKLLSLFYSVGAILGIIMCNHPLFKTSGNSGYQPLNILASIYLLVGIFILFYPIIVAKNDPSPQIASINVKNFKILSCFLITISTIYCLFCFPYITKSINAIDFVAYKDEIMEEGGLDISGGNPVLEKLFYFQILLRSYIVFFFCYSLAYIKGVRILKILLGLMSFLPALLHSLAAAHRNIIVFIVFYFIVGFVLFYKRYSSKTKRSFLLAFVLLSSIVVTITVYYAFLRFSGHNSGIDSFVEYSLLRYAGEPFVNFHTMMWGNDDLLYGNKCFPEVRSLLGMSYIPPGSIREVMSSSRYIIYYFYGIIGNFYMDFGPIGTMVLLIIISFIFCRLINHILKINSITRLLILFLYTTTTMQNYFYFEYMGTNNKLFISECIVVFMIYLFIDKCSLNKKCI